MMQHGLGLWLGSRALSSGGTPSPPVFPTNTRIGMNMSRASYYFPQRPFTNMLLGDAWTYPNGKLGPILPSVMNNAGEFIDGQSLAGNAQRGLSDVPGSGAHVLIYRLNGNATQAGGVTLTGSTISGIGSPVNHGDHWTREFTYTRGSFGNSITAWVTVNAATVGSNPPYDVMVCEKSLYDAAGGVIADIPVWHPAWVAWVADQGFNHLRFLNFMHTNQNGAWDVSWAERSQATYNAGAKEVLAYSVAPAVGGVDSQALTFSAKSYIYGDAGDISYFSARVTSEMYPLQPMGEGGNAIAWALDMEAETDTITVVDDEDDEIFITLAPPAEAKTAAEIVAWYDAATGSSAQIAKRWLVPGGDFSGAWGGNAGSTTIASLPKTYLQHGRKPGCPDGVKLEWLLDLAEMLNLPPWFTLPYRADAEYYEEFAAVVAGRGLTTARYGEHGNENWNPGFPIFQYISIRAAANGIDRQVQRANDHIACMNALRLGDPGITRVVNVFNATPGDSSSLITAGVSSSNTDYGAPAPYFASFYVPSGTTDIAAIDELMLADITPVLNNAIAHFNNFAGAGIGFITYEGGQSLYCNSGELSIYTDYQRSDLVRRTCNIYLAEFERRVASLAEDPVLFTWYSLATTITTREAGSFGAFEYQGQDIEEAPKAKAIREAKAGDFEPYFALNGSIGLSTMAPRVGDEITVSLPTAYHVVSTAYQWFDDTDTAIEGATAATYGATGSDVDKGIYCAITVTGPTARTWTYRSPTTAAVLPFSKFMVIHLDNDTIEAGEITLPADWSDTNTVHCFGPGGLGVTSTGGGHYYNPGGGGAYAGGTVTGLSPGAQVPVQLGIGMATTFNGGSVSADYGRNATDASGGFGAGGKAANSTGAVKYDGGEGGTVTGTFLNVPGAPGAAGPNGPGAAGGNGNSNGAGGGGGANGGSAGVASSGPNSPSSNGGANRLGSGAGVGGRSGADPTAGSNGGGGGGGNGAATPGNTNQYGAIGGVEVLFRDSVTGEEIGPSGGNGGSTSTVSRAGSNAGWGAGAVGSGNNVASQAGKPFIVLEWVPA